MVDSGIHFGAVDDLVGSLHPFPLPCHAVGHEYIWFSIAGLEWACHFLLWVVWDLHNSPGWVAWSGAALYISREAWPGGMGAWGAGVIF